MTFALIADLCGACREQDCECCDLLIWGGPCGCGCPSAILTSQMPQPYVVVLNKRYEPMPPRPQQRTHCLRGHPLKGSNVYTEAGSKKRRCWTCRRASWRMYRRQQHG